jgi:putative sterol carrier protein
MPDLFSPAGIAAWRAHLDRSAEFHRAAGRWSGTMVLSESDGERRRTWLALEQGVIAAARPADAADADAAEFVLAADAATWDGLVTGRVELIPAALNGQLRLERGQVWRLLPHAAAAASMLRAAAGP